MTNEEWLNNLNTEEKAKFLTRSCNGCIYVNGKCSEYTCENGIKEWLKREFIEPMPDLEVGDIVTDCGLSYVAINPMTLVSRDMRKQFRFEDKKNKIEKILRYDGYRYQCIWRADNGN